MAHTYNVQIHVNTLLLSSAPLPTPTPLSPSQSSSPSLPLLLLVSPSPLEDSGTYICIAINVAGQKRMDAVVCISSEICCDHSDYGPLATTKE